MSRNEDETRYSTDDIMAAMANAGFTKKQQRKMESALPACTVCWDEGTIEHDQFSPISGHSTTTEPCICQDAPAGDRLRRSAVIAAIRRR